MGCDPETVLNFAKTKAIRIATAESCTGGMVAAALTDIPGSSAVVECGFVTYSNEAKQAMLGVLGTTLNAVGAVSEDVACEMAEGALQRSGAQLSVAITGIAGPGGSEHKPEGRVCFAVAGTTLDTISKTIEFGAIGRANVRQASVDHALQMLFNALTAQP